MKISPGEEYGLRCLLQLARAYEGGGSLTLQEIANREGLPVPNTAKLLRRLRLAGIVISERGRTGGYILSQPPEQVTLAEVLHALDGPVFQPGKDCSTYAGSEENCVNRGDCSVRSLWSALEDLVRGALEKVTLADLAMTERRARKRFGTQWRGRVEFRAAWVPRDRSEEAAGPAG